MGSITLNKPSGGQLTLSPEDGATNETVTIPAGGVMAVDDPKVPTFSTTMSASTQSIASSSWTKVAFDTISVDTHNWFDTTNNRYQPQIAGSYLISASVQTRGSTLSRCIVDVSVSGQAGTRRIVDDNRGSGTTGMYSGSYLVHLNGSTDYVEIYTYLQSSGLYIGSSDGTNFSGFLVRAD